MLELQAGSVDRTAAIQLQLTGEIYFEIAAPIAAPFVLDLVGAELPVIRSQGNCHQGDDIARNVRN
jgi:hypothetical protein